MLKTLRFMLLAVLTTVCGNIFAQGETTVTWEASSGDDLTTIYPDANISLKWEEGGGDFAPKYLTSGESVYFYNGNRLTVAGTANDVTIKKIVFTLTGDKASLVTTNASGKTEITTGISTVGMITTWEGEASSLIFRAPKQTGARYISSIAVTYTGGTTGPVVTAPKLNITTTNWNDTYDMDEAKVFVVYAKNEGNAAAENAKVTVYVDDAVNTTWEIGTLAIGAENVWKNMKYNLEGIEAGNHQVKLALTADNADAFEVEKEVTFTKAAAEATFELTAQNVEVQLPADNITITVNVKNTSNIDATNVKINLWKNGIIATETIASLAAGEATDVNFTIDALAAGTYEMQALTEGNKYGTGTFTVTVLAEEEPEVKDLAIYSISGTIDQANETSNVRVIVVNNGNVDIADATVTLKAGETVLGTAKVSATAGQSGWADITVNTAGLTPGNLEVTATVEVEGDATPEDNTMTETLEVKAAPAPEATFTVTAENVTVPYDATNFTVVALLTNTSEIAGANVKVELRDGITTVAASQTVETLAASASTEVRLTVEGGPFNAGQKTYYLYVNDKYLNPVEVTFEEQPVEQVVDINLTAIQGVTEINLKETNTVQVLFDNNSTVDELNATITLSLNGNEVETKAITKNVNFLSFTLPTDGLTAGEEVTIVATLNAENNKEGNTASLETKLNVVSGEATEATLEVTAANVEVELAAQNVKVVVNVKNTSEVKLEQAEVKILQGMNQLGESKYVFGLEAGADQNVTIEIPNFEKAGTYELQAFAGKFGTYFNVTVKAPVVDLAIEAIQGTIDLAYTTSNVNVTVKNNGTADVKDAAVTLTAGENVLGTANVSAKAGEQGYAYIQVATEGLEAGELAVTATVEVEDDATPADNTKEGTLTVKAADAPQATFSVTAENVEVPFGAESFEIKATVKNTSEVTANGLTVKLLKGINQVDEKTLNITLAPGAETEVTFTVTEIGEAGKTATYYVQAGNAQAEVDVTFAQEVVAEVKDVAIEAIQGVIDLSASQSNVSVTVKNNGNVDVKNAKVTLSYNNETLEKTVSAKAGEEGYAFFVVPTEGITGETLAVTATVELEGDATPADNTKTAELTVKAAPAAEATLQLTAADVEAYVGEDINFTVNVKNTSDIVANDVIVQILFGTTVIGQSKYSYTLAAGEAVDVPFTIEKEMQLTARTYEMQAVSGKYSCFFNIVVKEKTEDVVDMALTQIQGVTEINLQDENKVLVWYKNEGNVATTATISATLNGNALEAQTVENVRAEAQGYVTFTLPVEGLTAGETAAFVATIAAEGDTNAENNTVSKELTIVSGEVEPQAEISINPIRGWEVEAGEQTVNVGVTLFNNGEVDAKDVKVEVFKSYGDGLCEAQTVDVPAGENNYKMLTFTFTYNFEAGKSYEFTAYTNFVDTNAEDNMQKFTLTCPAPVADVAIAKIADIVATTEEDVQIIAKVQNLSEFAAENVLVALYQGMEQVGTTQKVNEIEAQGEAQVGFDLGKLAAGTYNFTVQIISKDANTNNNIQDVSVKVAEPVAETVEVALTAIQGISNIDLAEGANNTISVWFENRGTVIADATVNVTLNGTALETQYATVSAGKNGHAEFTLPTTGLTAGEKATLVATITVEGNTSEEIELTREYDVVNSSVATEPVFTVAAQPVEVEFGAEKFNVVATVKNTSEIAATNVEMSLFYNSVIATQTIEALAAGAETTVTFEVANPFTKAGEYTMYVQAPKAQAEVIVTVKPEPVEEVVDLAISAIQGELSLENETNFVTVFVENKGNVDVQTASLSIEYTVGEGIYTNAITVSVKAGASNFKTFEIPTADLTAGEFTVTATVEVFNDQMESIVDADESNNTMEQKFTVKDVPAAEPTLVITANDIEITKGDDLEFTVHVANTSSLDAENVKVNILYQGILTIASKTIEKLAGNEETDLVFTAADITIPGVSSNDLPVGTYNLYVMTDDKKFGTSFTVTVKDAPAEEKVDLAVTTIQGTPSLDVENNYLTVFVDNLGTVDMTNVPVRLTIGNGVYTGTIASVKAGSENNSCTFTIPAADLWVGEVTVTATVTAENDVNTENNTLTKTYTVAAAKPELSFTIADVTTKVNVSSIDVKVTVKNSEKADAENVVVTVYDENSAQLGTATIEKLAAGAEQTVTITINKTYTLPGTYNSQLQVTVSGVEGVKWAAVTVEDVTTAIQAIRAKYGENVEIYTITGKKVNDVRRGFVYIINSKKVTVK